MFHELWVATAFLADAERQRKSVNWCPIAEFVLVTLDPRVRNLRRGDSKFLGTGNVEVEVSQMSLELHKPVGEPLVVSVVADGSSLNIHPVGFERAAWRRLTERNCPTADVMALVAYNELAER